MDGNIKLYASVSRKLLQHTTKLSLELEFLGSEGRQRLIATMQLKSNGVKTSLVLQQIVKKENTVENE